MEAVELLKQKVDDIIINAHPIHRIEADLQIVSGSYDMENRRLNTLVYGNIQNIVVKFHAKEPTNTSLLVNAHFDSGVKSPGEYLNDPSDNNNKLRFFRWKRRRNKLRHNVGSFKETRNVSGSFTTQHNLSL